MHGKLLSDGTSKPSCSPASNSTAKYCTGSQRKRNNGEAGETIAVLLRIPRFLVCNCRPASLACARGKITCAERPRVKSLESVGKGVRG